MVTSTKKHLWRLQEALYERAHADAIQLAVGASKRILNYADEYENSLPSKFKKVTKHDILQKLESTDILLYGDFHTLRQSQKGLIRLMRDLVSQKRPIVLAMETFRACDQEQIDKYLAKEIDETTFLEEVYYDQNWGFPWRNFKLLLDFASKHGVRVVGINSDSAGADSIERRDQFAANVLVENHELRPNAIIMCLIGEYHLADTKLPREISEKNSNIRVLKIVTNIDHYFFELQKEGLTASTQYLKLKPDLYCIMNVPPWIKWQSYTIWEESKDSLEEVSTDFNISTIDSLAEYNESGYDVDYHFFSLCKDLVNFLGIEISESELGRFYIVENPNTPVPVGEYHERAYLEVQAMRSAIDGTYFESRSQTIFATSFSLNGLSESAGQFVYHITSGFNDDAGDRVEQFYRRILKFAVGMVTSRVFNPRRKCSNINHALQYLKSTKSKKLNSLGTHKRQVAQNVMKHHYWMQRNIQFDAIRHPLSSVYRDDEKLHYSISRYIGLVLGFNLYSYIVMNGAAHSVMRRLFLNEMRDKKEVWETVRHLYDVTFSHQLVSSSPRRKIS